MGHQTDVYGYIDTDVGEATWEHNCAAINALPDWSDEARRYITRDMFAMPKGEYMSRLIPFGRAYHSLESKWGAWRAEFETFLATLDFDEAHVFV